MKRTLPRNLVASVTDRLRTMARHRGENVQVVLTQYGTERFLYRMSQGPMRNHFVLKGATLFYIWDSTSHRPTRDVDFLGYSDPSVDVIATIFRTICTENVEPDAIVFDPDTLTAEPIRGQQEYGGVRVKLIGFLGKIRIPLQIDVGFGDAVTPAPESVVFPPLLDFPAPHVRAYPAYTVVAEKFEAIVKLGIANSRIKDYYDLWVLSETQTFDGGTLKRAITATCERRGTVLPSELPVGLSDSFGRDPQKQTQWQVFLERDQLTAPADLLQVVEVIRLWLFPLMVSIQRNQALPHSLWTPGKGWSEG